MHSWMYGIIEACKLGWLTVIDGTEETKNITEIEIFIFIDPIGVIHMLIDLTP